MSYNVKIYSEWSESVPPEVMEEYGYSLHDGRNVLVISHDDGIIHMEVDGGEPEDNNFHRDYNWIKTALLEAYNLGKKDAFYV